MSQKTLCSNLNYLLMVVKEMIITPSRCPPSKMMIMVLNRDVVSKAMSRTKG